MPSMKITVVVTRKDLFEGCPDMPRSCPLALAVGRRIGKRPLDDIEVRVGNIVIDLDRGDKKYRAHHTKRSAAFVRAFDSFGKVWPSRYILTFKELS